MPITGRTAKAPATDARSAAQRAARRRGVARLAFALAAAPLALLPAACNIAAPIFFAVHGPGEVKKLYELDETRKTVVFVDDPASKVTQRRLRATIGETAQQLFLDRGIIDEGLVIDTRSAMQAALANTNGQTLSVVEIGEAVGADIVVYAVMTEFRTGVGGAEVSPVAAMNVIIVDVAKAEAIWPPDPAGYPLRLSMPASPADAADSRSDRLGREQALAQFAGTGLAQMFYDVEVPQSVRR